MQQRKDNIYERIGIYGIRNIVNNNIYIGKTGMNFGDRWDSHRSLLNNNKHDNPHLQNAWNKYGQDQFEFIVIEDCCVELLDEREQYYIKLYKDLNLAYNIHDGGNEGCNLGKHLSEETKRKIGEKNKINSFGKKASQKTKDKMSCSHKGKKYKDMSEKGKENIRKAQQRYAENNPKKLTIDDVLEIRQLHTDGLKYTEIAKKYNVTSQCISDICNYKRWKQIV